MKISSIDTEKDFLSLEEDRGKKGSSSHRRFIDNIRFYTSSAVQSIEMRRGETSAN